jgi:Fe2+ transport system protein FeoA
MGAHTSFLLYPLEIEYFPERFSSRFVRPFMKMTLDLAPAACMARIDGLPPSAASMKLLRFGIKAGTSIQCCECLQSGTRVIAVHGLRIAVNTHFARLIEVKIY